MEEVTRQIKDAIKQRGVTKYYIRKHTGLSWQQLENLLSGSGTISAANLIAVCKVLNINNLKL